MKSSVLFNKKILLTRPEIQSKQFAEKLIERGAIPIIIPLIEIQPLEQYGEIDNAIYDIEKFDYLIFTSANAVFYFMQRANFLQIEIRNIKIVAVGKATENRLKNFGLKVDIIPKKSYSKEIIYALGNGLKDKKILIPCANIARKELQKSLEEAGVVVYKVIVYETIFKELNNSELNEIKSKEFNAITCFSPSAIDALSAQINPELLTNIAIVCIGDTTKENALNKGFKQVFVAGLQTTDGIIEALEQAILQKNEE